MASKETLARRVERRKQLDKRLKSVTDIGDGIQAWPIEMRKGDAHQLIVDTQTGRRLWARAGRRIVRDETTGTGVNVAAEDIEPIAAQRVAYIVELRQAAAAKAAAEGTRVTGASKTSLASMKKAYEAAMKNGQPAAATPAADEKEGATA